MIFVIAPAITLCCSDHRTSEALLATDADRGQAAFFALVTQLTLNAILGRFGGRSACQEAFRARAKRLAELFGAIAFAVDCSLHDVIETVQLCPFIIWLRYATPAMSKVDARVGGWRRCAPLMVRRCDVVIFGLGQQVTLDTFPVARDKEIRERSEYIARRLVFERYDSLAVATTSGSPYVSLLTPPPDERRPSEDRSWTRADF